MRVLILFLASLAAALATARLGLWQLDRAAQKTAAYELLQGRDALPPLDAATLARTAAELDAQLQRRVRLEGTWLGEHTVLLDNRPMNGRVGFVVVTPLRLDVDDVVLVQRGWLPRDAHDRARVGEVATPAGRIRIEGRIAPGLARLYEFDAAASGAIRQNLDVASFAREAGLPLRPLAVVQLDDAADGLSRQWVSGAPDVSKHHGYALQWFALSALVTGLYVWFQLIRPRRAGDR